MRVYNKVPFLAYAIESLLQQQEQEFELLILDHGSSDGSRDIAADYAARDSRLTIIDCDRSIFLPDLCNIALNHARGEYFACQDADDISHPARLSRQRKFLEENLSVGAVGSAHEIIDEEGKIKGTQNNPQQHEDLVVALAFNNFLCHSTLFARTELVRRIGGYDSTMLLAHDYDLWWRLSKISRIHSLPQPLVQWRKSSNQLLVTQRNLQIEFSWKIAAAAIQEMAGTQFPLHLYRRLWLAVCNSSSPDLSIADLQKLETVWRLLARHPPSASLWSKNFEQVARNMIRAGQTMAGFYFLGLLRYRFAYPVSWRGAVYDWIKFRHTHPNSTYS